MGHNDVAGVAHQVGVREVGHVLAGEHAAVVAVLHRGAVDDLAARKVEQVHAGLALGERVGVDQVVRDALDVRHVHGDVVGLREEVIQLGDALHAVAGKLQRGVQREHGVVANNLHAEPERRLHHLGADGAEADHADGLARDLLAAEHGFVRLDALGDLVVVAALLLVDDVVHVVVALDDPARGEQQGAHHQLLHGVGVRAGRVEHGDAALGHLLDGDVVGARAAAHDAANGGGDVVQLHLVRAEHDAHGGVGERRLVAGNHVLALGVLVQTDGGDGVEGLDRETLAVVALRGGSAGDGRRRLSLLALLGQLEHLLQEHNLVGLAGGGGRTHGDAARGRARGLEGGAGAELAGQRLGRGRGHLGGGGHRI